jgi:hypothetical protein
MQKLRTIRNCSPKFSFQCPKQWEELSETDSSLVRFCNLCTSNVFFCDTDADTIAHAQAGHCIARELPDPDGLPSIIVGRPSNPIEPTIEQLQVQALWARERGIDDSIANAMSSTRSCQKCGYPAPDWRKTCRVCGFEMGRTSESNA